MGFVLPDIDRARFEAALHGFATVELSGEAMERLWAHYQGLVQWNRGLSLVGPGTAEEVLARHYGESLAALSLLAPDDRCLVDVGSGAGFPGFVLAACRPDMEVTLCEARQKKWSFLALICQKTALPCHCLNARVGAVLPQGFPYQVDVLVSRAVRLSASDLSVLESRLSRGGRFLVWTGQEPPAVFDAHSIGRRIPLLGAEKRQIVEIFPPSEAG